MSKTGLDPSAGKYSLLALIIHKRKFLTIYKKGEIAVSILMILEMTGSTILFSKGSSLESLENTIPSVWTDGWPARRKIVEGILGTWIASGR